MEDYISIVGVASRIKTDEAADILLNYNLQGKNVFYLEKIYKNKVLFTSEVGQGDKKTESYFVKYNDDVNVCIGSINHFLRVTDSLIM